MSGQALDAVEADRERTPGVLERLLDRTVGGLTGEVGRVASTSHTFLIFSLFLSLAYAAFYMTYDISGLSGLIAVNMVAAGGYSAGILVVRLGKQAAASVIALGVASAQILLSTQFLGWESGLHLYLVAGGQLVLMIFTEQQRTFRWSFVMIAAATFVYCQSVLSAEYAAYAMPSHVLSVMFSINAVVTAGLMYVLAAFAHVRASRASKRAVESAARAEYLANTDALTGLANRRPIMDHIEQLSARDNVEYCVALADLDRFKELNDEYGHVCGDRVLATLGARLRSQLRTNDSVGRWGGEEFIFVLEHVSLDDAVSMMERMRRTVGDHVVPCSGHTHHVTVSIGVADRQVGVMSHRAIKRADDALYAAKLGGRNQVRAYSEADAIDGGDFRNDVPINPDGGEGHRTHRRSN